jgi:hypothetical protein
MCSCRGWRPWSIRFSRAEPRPTPVPAVSVRKSITPDYLICLDDALKFRSLRRHLAKLRMTPEQYRAKWDLPSDYRWSRQTMRRCDRRWRRRSGLDICASERAPRTTVRRRTNLVAGGRRRKREPASVRLGQRLQGNRLKTTARTLRGLCLALAIMNMVVGSYPEM